MAKKSKKVEEEAPIEEEPTPEPEPEPEPELNSGKKIIKEKLGIDYKLLVYNDGSYDKVYD